MITEALEPFMPVIELALSAFLVGAIIVAVLLALLIAARPMLPKI